MDCDFMVRSENEDELVEMVQQHAQQTHDMDIERSEVHDMAKEA